MQQKVKTETTTTELGHENVSSQSPSPSPSRPNSELTNAEKKSAIRRIYRNLIVFSLSSMFFEASQKGVDSVQILLNSSSSKNLGLYVHLISSGVSIIFCFFLPIISMKEFGYKWTLVVYQTISLGYILANEFRYIYIVLPAAALHGISSVVLYSLHGSLIASLTKDYLSYTNQQKGKTLVRFFAINGVILHFSKSSGNNYLDLNLKLSLKYNS